MGGAGGVEDLDAALGALGAPEGQARDAHRLAVGACGALGPDGTVCTRRPLRSDCSVGAGRPRGAGANEVSGAGGVEDLDAALGALDAPEGQARDAHRMAVHAGGALRPDRSVGAGRSLGAGRAGEAGADEVGRARGIEDLDSTFGTARAPEGEGGDGHGGAVVAGRALSSGRSGGAGGAHDAVGALRAGSAGAHPVGGAGGVGDEHTALGTDEAPEGEGAHRDSGAVRARWSDGACGAHRAVGPRGAHRTVGAGRTGGAIRAGRALRTGLTLGAGRSDLALGTLGPGGADHVHARPAARARGHRLALGALGVETGEARVVGEDELYLFVRQRVVRPTRAHRVGGGDEPEAGRHLGVLADLDAQPALTVAEERGRVDVDRDRKVAVDDLDVLGRAPGERRGAVRAVVDGEGHRHRRLQRVAGGVGQLSFEAKGGRRLRVSEPRDHAAEEGEAEEASSGHAHPSLPTEKRSR